jgi:hypothetical protein
MATGDILLEKIGVYYDTTISAGMTGQHLSGATFLSGAKFIYLPQGNGQTLVLRQTVTGW